MSEDAGFQVDVDAVLDPTSAKRLEDVIAKAIEKGFAKAMSNSRQWESILKKVAQGFNQAQAASASATNTSTAGFTKMEDAAKQYTLALNALGLATSNISATIKRVISDEDNAGKRSREEYLANTRTKTSALNNAAKQAQQIARTEGELTVNAAKVAGKQRVQLTRSVLETIGRLERGAGTAIVGIARTTTSAIGRLYTSLGSVIRRSDSGMDDGLRASLHTRENMMRSSFGRQEQIVRASAIKQQEIQRSVSTGVLGGLTGRGVGVGVAAVVGGIGLAATLKAGFADAVNFREQVNKSNVVFGEFAGTVLDFVESAPRALGATRAEALSAAATFGNLFKSINITDDVSAGMSTTLVQLAADMSSFNNVPVDEVFTALRAGLTGESEPLKRLGVDVSDAALKLEAMNMGIYDGSGLLTQQQKAQAAYSIVLNKTTHQQGDFARTAREGANAIRTRQKALTEFVSQAFAVVLPAITLINLGLADIFTGLTTFLNGSTLGPGLTLLRQGLKGVAIAMGLVIAAKGAVEVISLLGKALALVASPLGVLLVVAGLIGGAISILMSRSSALRDTVGELRARFGELVETIRAKVQPILDHTTSFLDKTLIPAIDRVAQFLADNLVGALDATVAFITDTAIPAFFTLAHAVGDILGPALEFVGEKASAFWKIVSPILSPAIEGFRDLGRAIGSAISGDFSGLGSGAASALSGIGATVAGLALAVGKALLPVGQTLIHWFASLFSGENLKRYLVFFMDFVTAAGEVIGRIATSPFLVKAVAGIAAAAAVLALSFAKGFVTGFIKNLPGLLDMIGDALGAGLKLALGNIGTVLLGALGLVAILPRLKSMFGMAGAEAGGGFMSRMGAKITSSRQFVMSAFGGVATGVRQALGKELAQINRQMTALGGRPTIAFNVNQQTVADAKAALAKLKAGFTDAEIAGRMFRQNTAQNMTALGGVLRGTGGALNAAITAPFRAAAFGNSVKSYGSSTARSFVQGVGLSLQSSGQQIASGLQGAFTSLQTLAAQQGTSIGKIIGGAVRVGAQVGLSAFVGGKVAGETGGSPIMAALTAGVAGFSIGGPHAAAIGAGAAGLSLLTSAFFGAGAEAKRFTETVKETASAIKTELVDAIKAGTIASDAFAAGTLDVGDVSGLNAVRDSFVSELGDDGVATFAKLGLQWKTSVLPILRGGGDLDTLKDKLKTTFAQAATSSKTFTDAFGSDSAEIARLVKEAIANGKTSTEFLNDISDRTGAAARLGVYAENADGLRTLVADIINTSGDLTRAAGITSAALEGINNAAQFDPADPAPIVSGIDTVERRLGDLGVIIAGVDAQLVSLFNPDDSTLLTAIDNAAIVAEGLGRQRGDAATGGAFTSQAQVRGVDRQMAAQLAGLFQTGVTEGAIIDDASAKEILKPVIDAFVSGISDPATADSVRLALEAQLTGLSATIENIKIAEETKNQLQALIAAGFGDVPLTTDTGKALLDLDLSLADVQEYARTHPLVAELSVQEQAAALVAAELRKQWVPLAPRLNEDGDFIGRALGGGLVEGMDAKRLAVAQAAARLAAGAVNTIRRDMKIFSPSKVFFKIGQQIGDGLADGIAASTEKVTDAMGDLIKRMLGSFAPDDPESPLDEISRAFPGLIDQPGFRGALNRAISAGNLDELQEFLTPGLGLGRPNRELPTFGSPVTIPTEDTGFNSESLSDILAGLARAGVGNPFAGQDQTTIDQGVRNIINNFYPPTDDPSAIALQVANSQASSLFR